MNQTYRNYYRDYFKSPNGRAVKRRAENKYRKRIREQAKKGNTMIKKSKNMTREEFNGIKALTKFGELSTSKICTVSGRSWNTVSAIRNSENFEEYRRKIQEQSQRWAKPVKPSQPVEGVARAIDYLDIGSRDLNSPDPDLIQALDKLSQALSDLALSWNHLSDKLDDVLETKRPWIFGTKGK